jgi:hypothetical protein
MYYVLISLIIRRGYMRGGGGEERSGGPQGTQPANMYWRQIKKNSQPSPNSAQDLFYENKKGCIENCASSINFLIFLLPLHFNF